MLQLQRPRRLQRHPPCLRVSPLPAAPHPGRPGLQLQAAEVGRLVLRSRASGSWPLFALACMGRGSSKTANCFITSGAPVWYLAESRCSSFCRLSPRHLQRSAAHCKECYARPSSSARCRIDPSSPELCSSRLRNRVRGLSCFRDRRELARPRTGLQARD